MHYLAKLYKHRAEQLQEQVKILEQKLNSLQEEAPLFTFKKGAQNQPYMSDDELRKQMTWHKTSGLFGSEVAYDKQSQEYRDAKEELDRRAAEAAAKSAKPAPAAPAPKAEKPGKSALPTATEVKKTQEVADKTQMPTALPTNVSPGTMNMTDMDGRPIAVQPQPQPAKPVQPPSLGGKQLSGRAPMYPTSSPDVSQEKPSPTYIGIGQVGQSGKRELPWVTTQSVPPGAAATTPSGLVPTTIPVPSRGTRNQASRMSPPPSDEQIIGPGRESGPGIPDLEQQISGFEALGLPIPGGPVNRANMTGERNMPATSTQSEIDNAIAIMTGAPRPGSKPKQPTATNSQFYPGISQLPPEAPKDTFDFTKAGKGAGEQLSNVNYPWMKGMMDRGNRAKSFSSIPTKQAAKPARDLYSYGTPEWNAASEEERAAFVREKLAQGNMYQVLGGLSAEEEGGFLGIGARKTGRIGTKGMVGPGASGFRGSKSQEQVAKELNDLLDKYK